MISKIFLSWLNVYLALYRYLSLKKTIFSMIKIRPDRHSNASSRGFSSFLLYKSKTSILLIVLFCVLVCFPSYLYPTVRITNCKDFNSTQSSCYYFDQSELNRMSGNLIFVASFYLQAIFVKIIPCLLLVAFICLLVKLFIAIKNRESSMVRNCIQNKT